MPRLSALAVSAAALALAPACTPAERAAPDTGKTAETAAPASAQYVGQTGEVPIRNRAGAQIGTAYLTEGPAGVLIRFAFNAGALPPGWHGVHFHHVGGCDDGAPGFTHSSSHIGSADGRHGLLNPNGPEPGDLPSIHAPASGAWEAELYSPFLTLAPSAGTRAQIWDADGSSLIIHANRDDQSSQPIGGAGDRLACAAFTAG